jgi:hypothetical protein
MGDFDLVAGTSWMCRGCATGVNKVRLPQRYFVLVHFRYVVYPNKPHMYSFYIERNTSKGAVVRHHSQSLLFLKKTSAYALVDAHLPKPAFQVDTVSCAVS